VVVAACGVMLASGEVPAVPSSSTPTAVGSPGIGDPYYPTYGNGGYDVRHYALDLSYDLKTGGYAGPRSFGASRPSGSTGSTST
jgi:hypothetical protein